MIERAGEGAPRWLLVATLAAGCGRLGYETQPRDARADAALEDAWSATMRDASALDASLEDAWSEPMRDASPDAWSIEETLVLTIEDDLDDGELETSGAFGYAPQGERMGWTYMGGYDAASQSGVPGLGLTFSYFRFRLARAIAAGATIRGARLRLFGTSTWEWDPDDYVWIALEDSADAEAPRSVADTPLLPTGRPLTVRVRWPASGELEWPIGVWHESVDFTPALQELVDRYGGLAAGSHVQVFVGRDGGETNGEIAAEDFSNPASHHAELTIAWR